MAQNDDAGREIVQARLNDLCSDYDRTADMGLFPHDNAGRPIDMPARGFNALSIADDSTRDAVDRDQAIWSLVYRQTRRTRVKEMPELLYTIATTAREDILRRSSSWALFKIGEVQLLTQSLRSDDSGNVSSWKQHLIYESQGRTDWVDPRPIRALKSDEGYGVTLPLTIHGVVVFRTLKADAARTHSVKTFAAARPAYAGVDAPVSRTPTMQHSYDTRANSAYSQSVDYRPAGGAPPPDAFEWHSLPVGPIAQGRLVGDLTAAVAPGSFYDNLIIQKVASNPFDAGFDHVQGYLFQGMSRSLGGNAMAHYYTSRGLQPLYLSGIIGDASEGVIDVETQLIRHAETHLVTNAAVSYPYVQSVRGLFFGPARMNTVIVNAPDTPLDNLLQIVRDPYANGWFFGEFRSVPVDVDGDGQVEINGMEMYTDLSGRVVNRRPAGPQASLAFAR